MRFVATYTPISYGKTSQLGASCPTLLWHDTSLENNWRTGSLKFANKPFSLVAIVLKHVTAIVKGLCLLLPKIACKIQHKNQSFTIIHQHSVQTVTTVCMAWYHTVGSYCGK